MGMSLASPCQVIPPSSGGNVTVGDKRGPLRGEREVDFAAGKRRRGSYRYLSLSQNLRFCQLPRQREPFQRD